MSSPFEGAPSMPFVPLVPGNPSLPSFPGVPSTPSFPFGPGGPCTPSHGKSSWIIRRRVTCGATPAGAYKDAEMNDVRFTTVQNVADRTFFQRQNRWVDSALLKTENDKPHS